MKIPLLRSNMRKDAGFQIRPARDGDWCAIERMLTWDDRCYQALEWWTIQEWLGSPTFLVATDRHGRSLGLILAISSDSPIFWLRAISVGTDANLGSLLEASAQTVLAQGGKGVAFLGNEGWILSQLRETGFRKVNQVVTLVSRGTWNTHPGPLDLMVRVATSADIDAVMAVDRAAFAPMWWYGRDVLLRALNLAHSFDVAFYGSDCVGYQLSTLRSGRGHIVRLATHPGWQRLGIGGRLLTEAMTAFDTANAASVTVNTQEDNQISIQLYHRFAFKRVGKPWAVWFRSLV